MGSLRHVASWDLDDFHSEHLQPDQEFLRRAGEEIKHICDFLKRRCFQDAPWTGVKVLKVVKGGSLGKGTSMKKGTADLELFLNIFKTYTDQEKERKKIIEEVERCLKKPMVQRFSGVQVLFSDLIKTYKAQEKERKMFIEETARRNDEWQKQPYLSDADLELFSNIFKSYAGQEKDWMRLIEKIAQKFNRWHFSHRDSDLFQHLYSYKCLEKVWKIIEEAERLVNEWYVAHRGWDLLWDLIKSYMDQEKDRKKIIEETERRVNNRQMKPYLSDADLVLFLNIFRSFTDQEKRRKGIIEEIERRLDEWQKEPYTLSVDVGFLLHLLESYRDLTKDPEEITQKIKMWLRECKKELYLSDADMVQFNNILETYLKLENDRMTIIKEIKWWQYKSSLRLYFSNTDLRFLLNFYKIYREMEKEQRMMTEDIKLWRKEGWGEPYLSNADLELLLDILKRYTEKEEEQKVISKEMEMWFNQCKENLRLEFIFEKSKWSNPRVLQFKLRSKKSVDFIEFDVLPTYDALGKYDGSRPDPQIYVKLIRTGKCGEFSPCFTELQRDFIVDRPTKLKNLIRLVKYWYKEVEGKSFPPKYALELLTVYAWEEGSGQDEFDTAEGFRTVLWLIQHYKEIRIYWTKYYNFDNEIIKRYLQDQLCKNRPVILDPADPTANLGEAKGWDRLARKAKSYTVMNCCRKGDGSLVEPWNVPLAKEVRQEEGWCTLL